ncbi:MAG: hypothetical protein R2727_09555 [Bacteroidales bacterium]
MAFDSYQLLQLAKDYNYDVNSIYEPVLAYHNQRYESEQESINSSMVIGMLILILLILMVTEEQTPGRSYFGLPAARQVARDRIACTGAPTIGSMYSNTGLDYFGADGEALSAGRLRDSGQLLLTNNDNHSCNYPADSLCCQNLFCLRDWDLLASCYTVATVSTCISYRQADAVLSTRSWRECSPAIWIRLCWGAAGFLL